MAFLPTVGRGFVALGGFLSGGRSWYESVGGRSGYASGGGRDLLTMEEAPDLPNLANDQRNLFTATDFRKLLSAGRYLADNAPDVSGAIADKANFAVGDGWIPQYQGSDRRWGERAEAFLREHNRIADVRGAPYSMSGNLWTGSVTLDRDGGYFLYRAKTADGYPMEQIIEAHRIGNGMQPNGLITKGDWAGNTLRNGVVYSPIGRAVAYHFLGASAEDDQFIPATRITPIFDPRYFSQGRGIPSVLVGAIYLLMAHGWLQDEAVAQRIIAAIAILESNEEGIPKNGGRFALPGVTKTAEDGATQTELVEEVRRGQRRYLRIKGEKIEIPAADRPAQNQLTFVESLFRSALNGMEWTYAQARNGSGITGPGVRRDVDRNRRFCTRRQSVLMLHWRQSVLWAIAGGIEAGLLPAVSDWWRWTPQLPRKLSIDESKDRNTALAEIRSGIRSEIEDLRERGKDEGDHIDELIRYYQLKRQKAAAIGVQPGSREYIEIFGSNDPNPTATAADSSAEDDPEDSDNTDEESTDQ